MIQILLINISPDPVKRYSVETTIQKFEQLYYVNESIANYLLLISSLKI